MHLATSTTAVLWKWWVTQSSLTLCNSMDCSPPGSSVHGILQAKILECVAILSSRGSSWPKDQTHISCISRWILYRLSHQGRPTATTTSQNSVISCLEDWSGFQTGFPIPPFAPHILGSKEQQSESLKFEMQWCCFSHQNHLLSSHSALYNGHRGPESLSIHPLWPFPPQPCHRPVPSSHTGFCVALHSPCGSSGSKSWLLPWSRPCPQHAHVA